MLRFCRTGAYNLGGSGKPCKQGNVNRGSYNVRSFKNEPSTTSVNLDSVQNFHKPRSVRIPQRQFILDRPKTPCFVSGACIIWGVCCAPGFSDHDAQHLSGKRVRHSVVLAPTMRRFLTEPLLSTRPMGSSPPAPTPPYVEHIKQGLTTIQPQFKSLGALAASTSAIALSVASPSCDPTDTALDERGLPKESCWGTAYETAKIAVDIANASSDMCLPLKAVVGALSVLIKNYDVRFPRAS